jgi:hypothetical protein
MLAPCDVSASGHGEVVPFPVAGAGPLERQVNHAAGFQRVGRQVGAVNAQARVAGLGFLGRLPVVATPVDRCGGPPLDP